MEISVKEDTYVLLGIKGLIQSTQDGLNTKYTRCLKYKVHEMPLMQSTRDAFNTKYTRCLKYKVHEMPLIQSTREGFNAKYTRKL